MPAVSFMLVFYPFFVIQELLRHEVLCTSPNNRRFPDFLSLEKMEVSAVF